LGRNDPTRLAVRVRRGGILVPPTERHEGNDQQRPTESAVAEESRGGASKKKTRIPLFEAQRDNAARSASFSFFVGRNFNSDKKIGRAEPSEACPPWRALLLSQHVLLPAVRSSLYPAAVTEKHPPMIFLIAYPDIRIVLNSFRISAKLVSNRKFLRVLLFDLGRNDAASLAVRVRRGGMVVPPVPSAAEGSEADLWPRRDLLFPTKRRASAAAPHLFHVAHSPRRMSVLGSNGLRSKDLSYIEAERRGARHHRSPGCGAKEGARRRRVGPIRVVVFSGPRGRKCWGMAGKSWRGGR
jgi:hypothetical protein